jgi:hypothetical protein
MNPRPLIRCTIAAVLSALVAVASPAQIKSSGSEAVPPLLRPKPPAVEPTMPPAHPFHDSRYGVTFTVPAAWNLNRKDAEVSTFNLDARSIAHTTQLRAVASIDFNPHPNSTFSGALFYFSVTPHLSAAECSAQATAQAPHSASTAQIGGLSFTHGYDEHGGICTESRDEIYTTPHNNACYRFDAVINTFCGGDVSGVQDITPGELDAVRHRMQKILDSVHFDTN